MCAAYLRWLGRFIFLKGSAMSITVSSSLASYFSPTGMPPRDRRGTAERRVPMAVKPLAESESSWGRHALLAGFLGVVLGSTGVMAVLAQRAASHPEQTANLMSVEQPKTAVTETPLRFDAAPVMSASSAALAANASSAMARVTGAATVEATGAVTVEAVAGAESYSEDAPGVPGATYREPPVIQPEASRPPATTAR